MKNDKEEKRNGYNFAISTFYIYFISLLATDLLHLITDT